MLPDENKKKRPLRTGNETSGWFGELTPSKSAYRQGSAISSSSSSSRRWGACTRATAAYVRAPWTLEASAFCFFLCTIAVNAISQADLWCVRHDATSLYARTCIRGGRIRAEPDGRSALSRFLLLSQKPRAALYLTITIITNATNAILIYSIYWLMSVLDL